MGGGPNTAPRILPVTLWWNGAVVWLTIKTYPLYPLKLAVVWPSSQKSLPITSSTPTFGLEGVGKGAHRHHIWLGVGLDGYIQSVA